MATLKEQLEAARTTAQDYIEGLKADGHEVTDAELAEARKKSDLVKDLAAKVDRQKSLSVFDGIGGGEHYLDRDTAAFGAKGWAADVTSALREKAGTYGSKSILDTTLDVPKVLVDPVPLEQRPNSLLQLFRRATLAPSDGLTGASSFQFIQQTLRGHNVATVPEGGLKPTSLYEWGEKTDKVYTLAHLSEELPESFLSDYGALADLLQSEMRAGLLDALEEKLLNGTGAVAPRVDSADIEVSPAGADITGLLNTSGIKIVPAVEGDLLTTLSNGRFSQTEQGDAPTAWILNPRDLQRLLLLRENGTTGALMFGSGRTQLEAFVGDAPIIESSRMPAGTALVGDFDKALLVTRQDATLDVDRSGKRFERNRVVFRLEGRYGLGVLRPSAFTRVTLPA